MTHLIDDIATRAGHDTYNMVVEIPAGTTEKWETDTETGALHHALENGAPRVIRFLPYPFNYGFMPQTVHPKAQGGDGDALDVALLAPALPRGSIVPFRPIGALKLWAPSGTDEKIIGVPETGAYSEITELSDLFIQYPNTVEILRLWFDGYKGPGKMVFQGFATRADVLATIETHVGYWKAQR